mmetsp:Transcript_27479/g.48822  ORF Transcript_27479/g.48822 Transcript_27479/m.48822 type:complete len:364 (+) Transcript_27479:2-1093(+)
MDFKIGGVFKVALDIKSPWRDTVSGDMGLVTLRRGGKDIQIQLPTVVEKLQSLACQLKFCIATIQVLKNDILVNSLGRSLKTKYQALLAKEQNYQNKLQQIQNDIQIKVSGRIAFLFYGTAEFDRVQEEMESAVGECIEARVDVEMLYKQQTIPISCKYCYRRELDDECAGPQALSNTGRFQEYRKTWSTAFTDYGELFGWALGIGITRETMTASGTFRKSSFEFDLAVDTGGDALKGSGGPFLKVPSQFKVSAWDAVMTSDEEKDKLQQIKAFADVAELEVIKAIDFIQHTLARQSSPELRRNGLSLSLSGFGVREPIVEAPPTPAPSQAPSTAEAPSNAPSGSQAPSGTPSNAPSESQAPS